MISLRDVVVNGAGLSHRSKNVRTPVVQLRFLSDLYPWKKYQLPYPLGMD